MVERGVRYRIPNDIVLTRTGETTAVVSFPDSERNKLLEGSGVDSVEAIFPLLRTGKSVEEVVSCLGTADSTVKTLLSELEAIGAVQAVNPQTDNCVVLRTTVAEHGIRLAILGTRSLPVEDNSVLEPLSEPSDIVDAEADILVSVTTETDPEFHHDILDRVTQENMSWVPGRLYDGTIRIGPFTTSGTPVCYNCYDQRRRASRTDEPLQHQIEIARAETGTSYHSADRAMLRSLLVGQVLDMIDERRRPSTRAALLTVDPRTGSGSTSEIVRVPTCYICGQN